MCVITCNKKVFYQDKVLSIKIFLFSFYAYCFNTVIVASLHDVATIVHQLAEEKHFLISICIC